MVLATREKRALPPFPFRNKELEGCVLYAPLWHEKLRGSPFKSLDHNHHSCTVTGTTWSAKTGRTFNGTSDKISVPDHSTFSITDFIAVEAVVYPTTVADTLRSIVCKCSPVTGDGWWLYRDLAILGVQIKIGVTWQTLTKASYFSVNNRYRVGFTFDGANLRLYGNGEEVASAAYSGAIATNTKVLMIGEDSVLAGRYWTGEIGEVWVQNQDLKASEFKRRDELTKGRYSA